MKVQHGFTFFHKNADYFYFTDRKYITSALCREILAAMQYPKNENNLLALSKILSEGEFEEKITQSGKKLWIIRGTRAADQFSVISLANSDDIICLRLSNN